MMWRFNLDLQSWHVITFSVFLLWTGVVSSVRSEGSSSWLLRAFSWAYQLFLSIMHLDTLLLSRWHTTRVEQEHDLFYEQDGYTETDAISRSFSSRKRNTWRLFLLLLPLIFLAGKWFLHICDSDLWFIIWKLLKCICVNYLPALQPSVTISHGIKD